MVKQPAKLLIFVVAYNAEKYIEQVLQRIPSDIFEQFDSRILVSDDCSSDDTFQKSESFQHQHQGLPMHVIRHDQNLGYGGNQKVGYRYAIEHGFELVVLLHGDGQYAPEKMIDLLQPFQDPGVAAVFGSRMMTSGAALQGGMPLYKFWGNKILTYVQNKLLSTNLSEWHSGYRAFRVGTLEQLQFERLSRRFEFDSQIIIQLLCQGHTIKEVAIPTFYGSEISHVNGWYYAVKILYWSLLGAMHKANLLRVSVFESVHLRTASYKEKA